MRYTLLVLLLVLSLPVHAEMTLETIQLHNRTAQEVISILKPMLDKDGSITGSGYKLFIRSTPDNIAQLRQMLANIDVAARNLLVSVSMDPAVIQQNSEASARIHIQDDHHRIQLGSSDSKSPQHERQPRRHIMYDARLLAQMHTQRAPQAQTVRVSEGMWATIKTGQAVPIVSRTRNPDGSVTDTYTYQAVASGFQVLPRVSGDKVILKIRPQAQAVNNSNAGSFDTTELETTVSGKLGQWIALGGVSQLSQTTGKGITYQTDQHRSEYNQLFVKVELAKP
ncbi:MAG: hypothetical protein P8Z75_08590 [Gammaproteobacteria bacterium]|jgi:type II secretory pathway component GspD/PulD (secretin)